MTSIVEAITALKKEGADALRAQHIAALPRLEGTIYKRQVYEYMMSGSRTLVTQKTSICLKIDGLRILRTEKWKKNGYTDAKLDIATLVDGQFIFPFMLFVNTIFIPWSQIKLVSSFNQYYFLITPTNSTIFESIKSVTDVKIVTMPFKVTYSETSQVYEDTMIFTFNSSGVLSTANIAASYTIMDDSIAYLYYTFSIIDNGLEPVYARSLSTFASSGLDISNKRFTSDNAFIFIDGKLRTDISITFNGELITCNDGDVFATTDELVTGGISELLVFYNTGVADCHDIIHKMDQTVIQSALVDYKTNGGDYPSYIDQLSTAFNISMDRSVSYDDNVANAIAAIMEYDPSILSSAIIKDSNLEIVEMTGAEVITKGGVDGTLRLSRHGSTDDYYIVMLVNGELYKYYYTHRYYGDKFVIAIMGILEDDAVEFWYFKNVKNDIFTSTVNEEDDYLNISDTVLNDNTLVFCKDTPDTYYTYDTDGDQAFPVNYSIDTNTNGYKKIVFDNSYFYGKSLVLTYKNRFVYKRYILNVDNLENGVKLELGTDFLYCHDYSRYIVFYNRRRLGSDQFRLTLPVRTTTPFTTYNIYLTTPVETGDILEIMYLPSVMRDVSSMASIDTSGDITISKSSLPYGLDSKLYMVYVNGKKIPASHIANIGSNAFKIIHDEGSVYNVNVTKIVPDIDDILTYFQNNESIWDTIIGSLDSETLYSLLDIVGVTISNTDTDITEGSLDVTTIMWELIKTYYLEGAGIDTSQPFTYGYEDVDSSAIIATVNGVNSLGYFDANRDDHLDTST